ncbi:putative fluoride ion transporter CrcB [Clostridia bacterium]|nr:putative fluoride ion transporter CrcB [Clostridia bacterium]
MRFDMNIIFVGLGGFVGSVLRFLVSKFVQLDKFPAQTLIVNVAAAFAIGCVIGWERANGAFPPRVKLFLTTGALGGLSTFSAFSLETVQLFENRMYAAGLLNAALNVVLSLAAVLIGIKLNS